MARIGFVLLMAFVIELLHEGLGVELTDLPDYAPWLFWGGAALIIFGGSDDD